MAAGKIGREPLIRKSWIAASQFHELQDHQVLEEVYARVQRTPKPVVLLDLDSTLYEVGPRSHQIFKEWAVSSGSAQFPAIQKFFIEVLESHVGYSVRDTFQALKITDQHPEFQDALDSARSFWSKRFFTNAYLKYDRPYPGASEFAQKCHELGAHLVYLTGRDGPNMGAGTQANLLRDGFPWEVERVSLLCKAASHLNDLDHKRNAAIFIRKQGELVASFENEPPNLVALYELFPQAMHVFMDTVYSDHGAYPYAGLYRITQFTP